MESLTGKRVVNSIINPTANVFFVGEAPGDEENKHGTPFYKDAPAGSKFDTLLKMAGIGRHECSIGNVAREQPPYNQMNTFFEDKAMVVPKPDLRVWINQLKKEIEFYKPNIVVAMGRHALWALTGQTKIKQLRGYITESTLVPGTKVLPTWHPQATNYEYPLTWQVVMDLRKAIRNSKTPGMPKDDRHLQAGVSKKEFMDYLDWILHRDFHTPIALDVETTQPGGHIDIIGIADTPKHAMSFGLFSGRHPRYSLQEELDVWVKLARVVDKETVIMHNGLYDYAVLWHLYNILCKKYHDTMIATHVVWPEIPRSLGFLSSICLNVPAWKHEQTTLPLLYNASDAANTAGCWEVMEKELTKNNDWSTYNSEIRQVEPATFLQLRGQYVNPEVQKEMLYGNSAKGIKGIRPRIVELQKQVDVELGKKVNLRSPQQLKSVLYLDMRLPEQYQRRKSIRDAKVITTDAEALKKLKRLSNNPILDLIIEFKKLDTFAKFIDIELSPESRVHTSYNITGATTRRKKKGITVDDEEDHRSFGRWSSSESIILPYGSGNLQNIPEIARKMYTAPEGYYYVRGDYVQAEAVVVAYEIFDNKLIQMFKESFGMRRTERQERNFDVHKLTAAQMFGLVVEQITSQLRGIGKTLRHATNYSAGPGVVATKIGCSLAEAKRLLEIYHGTCPQLRLWHERIQRALRETKTLTNLLGRRHQFLQRWGDDLFRSAYSYIPQSTVGDLLNQALVDFYETYGSQYDLAFQLHDAMYTLVPEEDIPNVIRDMRKTMMRPLETANKTFFIDVDFGVGKSWGDVEEVEWHDYVSEEDIKESETIRNFMLAS